MLKTLGLLLSFALLCSAGTLQGGAHDHKMIRRARQTSSPTPPTLGLAWEASGQTFFDHWDFFTDVDPTHGAVNYVSAQDAWARGLVRTDAGVAELRTDNKTKLAQGALRDSVRVVSKRTIGIGSLVVVDFKTVPHGPGVWPAFWT